MSPKISVITINYNNAAGLRKTMQSVVSQSYRDFEYIIIDGGSTDGSIGVIEEFRNSVTRSVSEKDKGIYDAQNKGISQATGEYLLFLNSGDFLCNPAVLEKVSGFGLDRDIVYGDMYINWGEKISLGKMPAEISKEQMFRDTLWHPVSFIRSELFHNYGMYNLEYKMVADYEFFFRVIIKHKVSTKHIPLAICEFDTGGISSDPAKKETEKAERKRVIETYLSPAEISELEEKFMPKENQVQKLLARIRRLF